MKSKDLTVEEIVAALRHSSIPSIIVEGPDDVMIYRWILSDAGISDDRLFPCTGRNNLLQVFNRRNEFPKTPTLFIADKDVFVYSAVPVEYSDILFTEGYSIENDLYYGKAIEQLLRKDETVQYEKAKYNFIRYYGSQYENMREGIQFNYRQTPHELLDSNYELIEERIKTSFKEPLKSTCDYLLDNYDLMVRGHSIFLLLTKFLSAAKRDVKHSTNSLYEQCYRIHRTKYMDKIRDEIVRFNSQNVQ